MEKNSRTDLKVALQLCDVEADPILGVVDAGGTVILYDGDTALLLLREAHLLHVRLTLVYKAILRLRSFINWLFKNLRHHRYRIRTALLPVTVLLQYRALTASNIGRT